MEVILPLIIWSFFPLSAGFIAASKKRDAFSWFMMGLLSGPFALVVLLILRHVHKDRGGRTFANPEIQKMVSKGIYNGWKQGKLNLYKGETDRTTDSISVQRTVEGHDFIRASIGRPVKIIHTNVSKRKAENF